MKDRAAFDVPEMSIGLDGVTARLAGSLTLRLRRDANSVVDGAGSFRRD